MAYAYPSRQSRGDTRSRRRAKSKRAKFESQKRQRQLDVSRLEGARARGLWPDRPAIAHRSRVVRCLVLPPFLRAFLQQQPASA